MEPGAGDPEKRGSTAQPHHQQSLDSRPPPRNLLRLVALWASPIAMIILAVSTPVSLLFVVWNYNRNAEDQLHFFALANLQHYLDLALEHPDLASRSHDQPVDAQYAWFAAEELIITQTLWRLVGQQPDWQRIVNAMIRQNQPYLRSGALVCDNFTPEFVSYLRGRIVTLRCAELGSAQ